MKKNKVLLTAYKDVLFSSNQKIFQMEILIDDTKTNAILKKKMLKGEMEYKNKIIYIESIDDEEVELGSFDNLFFIENEDK
ncbi:MAG: hypothetical protein ACTH0S_08215 [Senegalia sp. (in: firmicutes)]